MKKIVTLSILCFLISQSLFSQSPQAFKYQAIARDDAGNILSNWEVGLRISIVAGMQDGAVDYMETHKVTSNIYGLINVAIGEGTVEHGDFKKINWGTNSHFIKMEMDAKGGNNYKEMGATQLYAVPYALYAEQAGNLVGTEKNEASSIQNKTREKTKSTGNRTSGTPNTRFPADTNSYINVNVGNVGIGTTEPQEKLDVVGKIVASEGFNTDGSDGITDTLNFVTDNDFLSDKLKYRTLFFNGGILTYISDTSAWVDTVGNYILPWECDGSWFDSRDGTYYQIVLIGTQCWLKENMNYEIGNSWCYNNNPDNCLIYGRLYDWQTALGVCPSGWHLPSDEEWKILEGTGDSQNGVGDPVWNDTGWRGTDAGYHLKSTTAWTTNGNGDDSFGFSALPGGYQFSGSFSHLGLGTFFSSSTEFSTSHIWYRNMAHDNVGVYRNGSSKTNGFSVRCLKD